MIWGLTDSQHSQVCRPMGFLAPSFPEHIFHNIFFLGCHKRCLFRRVCLCVFGGEYVLHGSVVHLGATVGLGVLFLQTTTTITILITITCF